jgi:hypothetical protein
MSGPGNIVAGIFRHQARQVFRAGEESKHEIHPSGDPSLGAESLTQSHLRSLPAAVWMRMVRFLHDSFGESMGHA